MKIFLCSDLHFNSRTSVDSFIKTIPNSDNYDCVVVCGDISNGQFDIAEYFFSFFDKPLFFTLGNHDYYNQSVEDCQKWASNLPYNYLTAGKSFSFMDKTFIGGTLFTDFTLNSNNDPRLIDKFKQEAKLLIYDFYYIKKENRLITPEDYVTLHNLDWNWINKFKNDPNVIVCTHFPPNPIALSDYWKERGGLLNSYFINTKSLDGFYYWLSGHVHHHFNYKIDTCNFICNPFGYAHEAYLSEFKHNYIINV